MRTATIVLWAALPLALVLAGLASTGRRDEPLPEGWRTFQGSWSAVGRRHSLPTDAGRAAAVVQLSGAVVLTDASGARFGFQGEAIGFDDGGSLAAGRAVWVDARGDRLFSALTGGPILTGRRITGTITGGSGRYAGASGGYELTWQYVVSGDEDNVQGRTADLRGRLRSGARQP